MPRSSLYLRAAGAPSSTPSMPGGAFRPVALAVHLTLAGTAIAAAGWTPRAHAQADAQQARRYTIPAGSLTAALNRFADEAGIFLSAPAELTQGRTSPGLSGTYTVERGFAELMRGQPLQAVRQQNGSYALRASAVPLSATSVSSPAEVTLPAVRVTAGTESLVSELPKPYAGGAVARGSQLGFLGNKDVLDTPFSTTAYTEQLIRDQQARTVTDVLANDPAVRNTQPSNFNETYTIRGFNQSLGDGNLLGLPGVLPEDSLDVGAVERVEIIKGPSALLTGMSGSFSGALGGAINIVPKRATTDPLSRATLSYGSDAQIGEHLDLGRRFGANGEMGARLNLIHREGDTAIDGLARRYTLVATGLDFQGERVRISGDFFYQNRYISSLIRSVSVAPGIAVPAAPRARNNWQSGAGLAENYFGVVRSEIDLSRDWTAHVAVGGVNSVEKFSFGFETIGNAAGDIAAPQIAGATSTSNRSYQLGLNGKFSTGPVHHQLSVGINALNTVSGFQFAFGSIQTNNIYRPTRYPVPGLNGITRDPPKSADNDLSSAAIADTLSWDEDRYQLTLGGRYQKITQRSFDGTSGAQTTRYRDDVIAPAAGFVFRPARHLSLFANYIEGLMPGETAPTTAANAGQQFSPFRTKQYEAGVKVDVGTVLTTISLFQIARPSSLTDPVTRVFSSSGEQRHRGLEITSAGEVQHGWRLLGGASFMEAKLTETAGGINQGNRAVGVPKVQVNLGTEWDVPVAAGLTLSGRVVHTGRQFLDPENQQSIPSWTRLDLGARYGVKVAGKPTSLNASLQNALNRNYWETAANSLSLGAPRTLWISASTEF